MTNLRYSEYLESLTTAKRRVAEEAVNQYLAGEADMPTQVFNSQDLFQASRHLSNKDEEYIILICMDIRNQIIKKVEIAKGGLTTCGADIRTIMRTALLNNSVNIALVHNHPSRCDKPSKADDELTKKLQKACDLLCIRLLDHVIVAGNNYYSYRDYERL